MSRHAELVMRAKLGVQRSAQAVQEMEARLAKVIELVSCLGLLLYIVVVAATFSTFVDREGALLFYVFELAQGGSGEACTQVHRFCRLTRALDGCPSQIFI